MIASIHEGDIVGGKRSNTVLNLGGALHYSVIHE